MKVFGLALVALLQPSFTYAFMQILTNINTRTNNNLNLDYYSPCNPSSSSSTSSIKANINTRLFASSAFGKAAIGKKKKKQPSRPRGHDIQIDKKPAACNIQDPIKTSKSLTIRTAMSTQQVLKRRHAALSALQSHLHLPTHKCVTILNRHPRLYTHLPDLSSKLSYLLEEINLKPQVISKMLSSHPRLMETVFLEREDDLVNTMDILRKELDLTEEDVQHIQTHSLPTISSYPRSELRKRILVYKQELSFTTGEIKKMVMRDSRMLRTDSLKTKRLLDVLKEELDIDRQDVSYMLQKELLLLTYNAEENIRPTIQYLLKGSLGTCLGGVERKGVSTLLLEDDQEEEKNQIVKERLKALVMGHPKVLSSSLERNLKPTVDFFLSDVGLSELEFGKVMYRRGGSLLEANVERTLTTKVDFLRRELGLEMDDDGDECGSASQDMRWHGQQVKLEAPLPSAESSESGVTRKLSNYEKTRLLAQMISTAPDILTLSIDNNLKPKFDYFRKNLKFTKEQLQYVILKRPQLLALNLDRNIIPKVEFFLQGRQPVRFDTVADKYEGGLGMTMDEIREWIVLYPQTLTFVLESRIRPRTLDVVKYDLQVGDEDGMAPMNFISRNEPSWKKWIEANVC